MDRRPERSLTLKGPMAEKGRAGKGYPSRHHPNRGQICRNSVKLRLTLRTGEGDLLFPRPPSVKPRTTLLPAIRPLPPVPAHAAKGCKARNQRQKPVRVPDWIDADATAWCQKRLIATCHSDLLVTRTWLPGPMRRRTPRSGPRFPQG